MTALQKWPQPRPVSLTIEDFLRLADSGTFRGYAKTELIEGVIVAMNALFSEHGHVHSELFRRVADTVEATMPGYRAWIDVSIAMPPANMPQPDIMVTSSGRSARGPVLAATVVLAIEVSDSTLAYDLGSKSRVYASAGIGEYWVADVDGRVIHQMWEPRGDRYAERREVAFGESVTAATITALIVETAGL